MRPHGSVCSPPAGGRHWPSKSTTTRPSARLQARPYDPVFPPQVPSLAQRPWPLALPVPSRRLMRFGGSSPQAGSPVRPSSPSVVGGASTPGFKGKATLGGERFRLAASSPPTEKGAQWPLPWLQPPQVVRRSEARFPSIPYVGADLSVAACPVGLQLAYVFLI